MAVAICHNELFKREFENISRRSVRSIWVLVIWRDGRGNGGERGDELTRDTLNSMGFEIFALSIDTVTCHVARIN